MATTYCTAAQVAELLQEKNFSSSTTPTVSTVEQIINRKEDFIDRFTHHAWREKSVSKEHHDLADKDAFDASDGWIVIDLRHRKIKTLDGGFGDKIELWNGSEWLDLIADSNFEEGRDKQYWLNYEEGILRLGVRNAFHRIDAVRVTYRFGEDFAPKDIEEACVKLVAADVGRASKKFVTTVEGSDTVTRTTQFDKWEAEAREILEAYREIQIPS